VSQANLDGVFTADFTAVRALLSRGRTYEKAVATFEPYKLVQEPDETARDAMRKIAERSIRQRQPVFVFVNNRLEGNAPSTIEAVVGRIEARTAEAKLVTKEWRDGARRAMMLNEAFAE
jgi:hypothetical protein